MPVLKCHYDMLRLACVSPCVGVAPLCLQNFGEFGPVRGMHIVPSKTIAFIRYHWRVTAEFAHVAMDQQSLQGSTLHEVRVWGCVVCTAYTVRFSCFP